MSGQLFTISLVDLQDLTTHAATASNAAADDNGPRERRAWEAFDAIIARVRTTAAGESLSNEALKGEA